jgi:hypothetical protein
MPTDEDLRATFSALELEAPDPAGTLAGLDRLRRRRTTRRRVTAMVVVAAVTLGAAGASLAVRDLTRHPAPPTQAANRPASPRLEFRFAIDDVPGFQTFYQIADPKFPHLAKVFPVGNTENPFEVNVFAPGAYDPTAARAGEPVEVRGKPGFYRPDMPCHCSGQSPVAGLAWEYAPNSWALVQYTSVGQRPADLRENMIRIASAVRFDKTTPVRVPFRVGWLPDGLRLDSGDVFNWDPARGGVFLGFAATDPQAPGLSIDVFAIGAKSTLPVSEPTVHDGLAGPVVLVNLGPFEVQLSSHVAGLVEQNRGGLPVDVLKRIAGSLTPVGDLHDVSTWVPASDAIPHT